MTERTRSEYRLDRSGAMHAAIEHAFVRPSDVGTEALASLLLDAYRGTIDDEGETIVEAREAIAFMLDRCVPACSWVSVHDDGRPAGLSFVAVVDGIHYIDPVVVHADGKRRGLGRRLVEASLDALGRDGVEVVGAAITDGNTASEALFASLGFRRVGPWPPD